MNTSTGSNVPPTAHASPKALAKASLGALAVAGAVVVLFVLPAEAGIDPTGAGSALGIAGMGAGEAEAAETPADAAPVAAVANAPTRESIESRTPWRTDEQVIELEPHSGIEVKAHMLKGDGYTFEWQATGPVKVDMHGEPPNAAEDEFTSYWIEKEATSQKGTFVAPIEGSHGWYWRNKGDTPVTVTLKVSGFYKDLYRP
ncbi:hypothetical protein [Croceicoccus sp. BE223]|uniref:hypothetical protein n=1 Tax=Croceicoccus sp. BE223 TaxID=2817716 RepID=UPI00285D23F7|nr:hypothetical protein [Croceicoccus sp. BE223]MDR7101620.1 hypothetical protein [Croceicoccus sp. BE223]